MLFIVHSTSIYEALTKPPGTTNGREKTGDVVSWLMMLTFPWVRGNKVYTYTIITDIIQMDALTRCTRKGDDISRL